MMPFSFWVDICTAAQITGPEEKTAGRTQGLQDCGRGVDPEEEGLEDSQVPRLSARGGAGKQKPRGISFAKPSPLTGLVWSVSTLVVRG